MAYIALFCIIVASIVITAIIESKNNAKCIECNWQGKLDQLDISTPMFCDEGIGCCPECGSSNILEI